MAETSDFTAKELKEIIRNDKMDISAAKYVLKVNEHFTDKQRAEMLNFIDEKEFNILTCKVIILEKKRDKLWEKINVNKKNLKNDILY